MLLKYVYFAEVILCKSPGVDFSIYLDKMIKGSKEDI